MIVIYLVPTRRYSHTRFGNDDLLWGSVDVQISVQMTLIRGLRARVDE